jgi:uncharacterized SAM-binding protein YcdF (DUF218 family)
VTHKKPGIRSKMRLFLKLPFYLFVAWALGFFLFYVRLPVPYQPKTLTADTIIVLTGGPERLEAGLKLLANKHGKKMLVSGVHKDVRPRELSALTGADKALFDCCITLDYSASNTLENAVEAAKWTSDVDAKSLILVTADYHVQRSILLFRKSMPDLVIIPFPVKSRMPLYKLAKEYNKYLATLVLELVGY